MSISSQVKALEMQRKLKESFNKGTDPLTEYKLACQYYKQIEAYEEKLRNSEKYKSLKETIDLDKSLALTNEVQEHFWTGGSDIYFCNRCSNDVSLNQGLACTLAAKEMWENGFTPIGTNARLVGHKYWNIDDKVSALAELVKVDPTDYDFWKLKRDIKDANLTLRYVVWGEAEYILNKYNPNRTDSKSRQATRINEADILPLDIIQQLNNPNRDKNLPLGLQGVDDMNLHDTDRKPNQKDYSKFQYTVNEVKNHNGWGFLMFPFGLWLVITMINLDLSLSGGCVLFRCCNVFWWFLLYHQRLV